MGCSSVLYSHEPSSSSSVSLVYALMALLDMHDEGTSMGLGSDDKAAQHFIFLVTVSVALVVIFALFLVMVSVAKSSHILVVHPLWLQIFFFFACPQL